MTEQPQPVVAPAPQEPVRDTRSFIKRLGPTGFLALGAIVLPLAGSGVLFANMNSAADWLRSHDGMGLVIYAAAFALLAGFALLPSYSSAILGGWAFGFAQGYPAALFGFTAGAMLGYGVCAYVTRDRVERIVEENVKARAIRDALVGGGFWKTLGIVCLVRVPPNSPFAMTNLVLASVQAPPVPVVLGTLIGMAPRTALAVWLSAEVRRETKSFSEVPDLPWWVWPAGVVAYVVVAVVIGLIVKHTLDRINRNGMAARADSEAGRV